MEDFVYGKLQRFNLEFSRQLSGVPRISTIHSLLLEKKKASHSLWADCVNADACRDRAVYSTTQPHNNPFRPRTCEQVANEANNIAERCVRIELKHSFYRSPVSSESHFLVQRLALPSLEPLITLIACNAT